MSTPVSGVPRMLLRIEALSIAIAAAVAYGRLDESWGLFALLFLLPDVGLVGYLAGSQVGATAYNALHTYAAPALLAALAWLGVVPDAWPLSLIWVSHIGFDRALGIGLKFGSSFRDTHLGTLGSSPMARMPR